MQVTLAQEMAQLGWELPEEARAAWAVGEAAALAAWARPGEARAARAAWAVGEAALAAWARPGEARAARAAGAGGEAALAAWARPGEARAAGAAQPEVAVLTLPMVQVGLVELPGRRAAAVVVAEREKPLVHR